MKTKLFLPIMVALGIGAASQTQAYQCVPSACSAQSVPIEVILEYHFEGERCAEYEEQCYTINELTTEVFYPVQIKVMSCKRCAQSYFKLAQFITGSTYCDDKFYVNDCEEDYSSSSYVCNQNSNCKSDSDWRSAGAGYWKKTNRSCQNNKCVEYGASYVCAPGYYGVSYDGKTGCTRCPSSGGVYGTSDYDSTDISYCYIPKDTAFSDETGSGKYVSECYWE